MKINENEFVWVEKYRPQTLDDILLPESVKSIFKGYIDSNEIPNLLLTSTSPGLGKTSVAKVLVKDTNSDMMMLNGNMDTGVDILRTRAMDFCSAASLDDTPRVVLVDECEMLSPQSMGSMKNFQETFTNVSFIFTANYINKIPEPVRNRMIHFDFDDIYFRNKAELSKVILRRLMYILENEGIEYDKNDLPKVIKAFYPSVRGMIQALQRFSSSGKLELNESLKEGANIYNLLIESIKDKNFKEMRSLVNNVVDCGGFYEYMFKNLDILEDPSKPEAILILAKYQDMDSSARDKMITLAACLVELMSKSKFV